MQLGDHVGDQGTPARLVRSAQTATGIAIEVLVKEEVVPEVRVGLKFLVVAENRTPPVLVAPEDVDHPAAKLVSDLLHRSLLAVADRALDAKLVAVELVESVQALDDEVVERHPDRPAPIGVSAEKIVLRFTRGVSDFGPEAGGFEDIRVLQVVTRQ